MKAIKLSKKELNRIIAVLLVLVIALAVFIPVVTALNNRAERNDGNIDITTTTTAVKTQNTELIQEVKNACARKGAKVYYPDDESVWEFREINKKDHTYFASTLVQIDEVDGEYELCCIYTGRGNQAKAHYLYIGGKVFLNDQEFNEELSKEGLPVK